VPLRCASPRSARFLGEKQPDVLRLARRDGEIGTGVYIPLSCR